MSEDVRRIGGTLVWLLLVIAIAFGAAGLVTASPSAGLQAARPELTGAVDAAVDRQLDLVEAELEGLTVDVDALGVQARGALSALVGGATETAEAAIDAGDAKLLEIDIRTTRIRGLLAAAPYVGGPAADLHVAPSVQARYARLRDGLATTEDLDDAWARLTSGALVAAKVSRSLAEHDRLVGEAAERGRDASYADAVDLLDAAGEEIKAATALRTQLANTVDVSVLDQWLERSATYDKALRALYIQLNKVGGRVTDAVRDAIAAEKEARKRLPPDSKALIVIIADIGRGGMNGAVIAIEEAKAALSDALEPVPVASPGTDPSTAPSEAP